MKAHYKTKSGQLTFEVQAETASAVFKQIADIQEIFDQTQCGCCQSPDIRFRVRTVEDNNFYELICLGCRARFQLGQNKKGGGLFPKRKDADGNWLPNGGWEVYQGNGQAAGSGKR